MVLLAGTHRTSADTATLSCKGRVLANNVTVRHTKVTALAAGHKQVVSPSACNGVYDHRPVRGEMVPTHDSVVEWLCAHRFTPNGLQMDARMVVYLVWALSATSNGAGGIIKGCGSKASDVRWSGTNASGWLNHTLRDIVTTILGFAVGSSVCAAATRDEFVPVRLLRDSEKVHAVWRLWFSEIVSVDPRALLTTVTGIAPSPMPSLLCDDDRDQLVRNGKFLGLVPWLYCGRVTATKSIAALVANTLQDSNDRKRYESVMRLINGGGARKTNARLSLEAGNVTQFVCFGIYRTRLPVNAPAVTNCVGTTRDRALDPDVLMLIDIGTSYSDESGLAIINAKAVAVLMALLQEKCELRCVVDVTDRVVRKALVPFSCPKIVWSRKQEKRRVVNVTNATEITWDWLYCVVVAAGAEEVVLHGVLPLPSTTIPESVRLGPWMTMLAGAMQSVAAVTIDIDGLIAAKDSGLVGDDAAYLADRLCAFESDGPLVDAQVDDFERVIGEARRLCDAAALKRAAAEVVDDDGDEAAKRARPGPVVDPALLF